MAETPPKRRAKPKRAEQSVLGTLPASRPERIGRPRREGAAKRAAAKPPPTTANGTTAKPRAAAANGTTAKPRAAAKRRPAAATPANGHAVKAHAGPKAVRPASPPLHAARASDAPPPKPIGAPTGTELVTTTIRAAGELAQIGFTVGGQVLKRTIGRIPKP